MDTSELHYVNCDPEAIWDKMQETYIAEGGDVLYPGDEKEILLRAVQAISVAILACVDNGLRQSTRRYSQGEFLDLYGEEHHCPRIEATKAKATVEITFEATGVAKTIPAQTELTADGVFLYHLTEDVTQTGAAQTVQAEIECSTAGAVGNGLTSGTQMQFIQSEDAVLSIYTTTAATGGQDREEQEAFRERIGEHGVVTNVAGPSGPYEAMAEAVSSLILDAKALNDDEGDVGIYLILASGASSSAIIQAVEDALSPRDKRPLNDHVEVHLATEVAYTLHPTIYYPSSENLADAITATIAEYKDWQDHTIGRAFNPDKLTAALFQLGVTRVQYASSDGISGAGAVYTEIAQRSHCVGTITPEVVIDA